MYFLGVLKLQFSGVESRSLVSEFFCALTYCWKNKVLNILLVTMIILIVMHMLERERVGARDLFVEHIMRICNKHEHNIGKKRHNTMDHIQICGQYNTFHEKL